MFSTVLVAVPFKVLSDNTPVELCLKHLIHFHRGLELLVIRLSPLAFRCSLRNSLKNGLRNASISYELPITWSICTPSLVMGSTFMSGSSFMRLPKPWYIGIKANHVSWDWLFHCSR